MFFVAFRECACCVQSTVPAVLCHMEPSSCRCCGSRITEYTNWVQHRCVEKKKKKRSDETHQMGSTESLYKAHRRYIIRLFNGTNVSTVQERLSVSWNQCTHRQISHRKISNSLPTVTTAVFFTPPLGPDFIFVYQKFQTNPSVYQIKNNCTTQGQLTRASVYFSEPLSSY